MTIKAFYSVIQYVPDGSRAEAANVGVVLFVPDRRTLDTRVSNSLERVRQFFRPGKTELRRTEMAIEAFKHRIELAQGEWVSESDLASFASARADSIRITLPKLVMVSEPLSDLDSLFEELVGDRQRSFDIALNISPLPSSVAEIFGRLETQHRVWRPGKITVPMASKEFEVRFAYKNGRVNYVRTESLADGKLDSKLAKLGFNGQLIHKHQIENQDAQLVVLSSNPRATQNTEIRFKHALQDCNVRFIPFEQADDFAAEVDKTAH